MCGIAGSININNLDITGIKNSLNHRGPDSQTHINIDNVCLIHTRLAIQDVQHGAQPLTIGNYTIVFNGEIYNHQQLRKEKLTDIDFLTNSDTETLLHLYIKYRESMLDEVDGMFAFAVLDKENNKLVLARDRAGKKPVYIYKDSEQLFFASELNAVKKAFPNLNVNNQSIESYLRLGFFFKENTPYQNVKCLPAGTITEYDLSSLEEKRKQYFNIADHYVVNNNRTFNDSLLEFEEKLRLSVKQRIESSDLEVGAFLSGGLDSSLVVAFASEYVDKLKTFTVKFDGAYDESHLAKLTANKYNTDHHELRIEVNLKRDIEKILLNYGQPFMDSSAIPSYYVSKEAKKHVTVILNGDGADEIFGGYRRYVPAANNILGLARTISPLLNVLPKSNNKKSYYNYFYRLLAMSKKKGLDFYLSSTTDIFEDVYKVKDNQITENADRFLKSLKFNNLNNMMYSDFEMLLFSDLLVKMDIATMANSIEGRSPFLSKYLLEFAPTLDNNSKINGKQTKFILRELARKYLPSDLINQPKRGFEVPLKQWVAVDLKENIHDTLSSNSFSSQFIDQAFISSLLENKVSVSEEKRAKMLWCMYCLDVWHSNL